MRSFQVNSILHFHNGTARNYSDFVPRCTITAVPVILYRCTLYTCTFVPAGGGAPGGVHCCTRGTVYTVHLYVLLYPRGGGCSWWCTPCVHCCTRATVYTVHLYSCTPGDAGVHCAVCTCIPCHCPLTTAVHLFTPA